MKFLKLDEVMKEILPGTFLSLERENFDFILLFIVDEPSENHIIQGSIHLNENDFLIYIGGNKKNYYFLYNKNLLKLSEYSDKKWKANIIYNL